MVIRTMGGRRLDVVAEQNRLCLECGRACKQAASTEIVRCPLRLSLGRDRAKGRDDGRLPTAAASGAR